MTYLNLTSCVISAQMISLACFHFTCEGLIKRKGGGRERSVRLSEGWGDERLSLSRPRSTDC